MDGLTDVRLSDGWMDRHKDVQRETIISRHYCVAGYNKYDVTTKYILTHIHNLVKIQCIYNVHHNVVSTTSKGTLLVNIQNCFCLRQAEYTDKYHLMIFDLMRIL